MAEQITHDVVKEAQSMGGPSPVDDTATSTSTPAGNGEAHSAAPTASSPPSDTPSTNATSTDGAPGRDTATSDKADADAVATPSAHASNSQDDAPPAPGTKEGLVNGDSAEHSAPEDSSAHHALGEASGGSDTDISRPGSVDPGKDRPAGHLRSNSIVKKHAPFKSVSVTKNFLAKSAVSTPAASPGLKPTPAGQTLSSTQPTQKPRLVAKSGSGLSVTRSSLSKTNGVGSGPDASKVWNKNQPVPPPPPKQFTDEELKQQYGIHLATRLQADESGGEAKWADIDDDEEDWVPDNVQWMDGTKSSVAAVAVENKPPPQEEPKPAGKKDVPLESAKPPPVPPTSAPRPSSTTGTKTILKPGAQTGSGKAGLVLKGQQEKPTLVAKPLTNAPAKSPWAPLPPVDKVSPVQSAPAHPPPPSRFTQRDAHGYDSMPPPHAPAKEIAADDFNRQWRSEQGTRELFNSHSGRYEPVNEMRRGSFRDNHRQQPSLLQRPSQDGPAEPSAAFQTRTSGETPAWGRRRGSSNASGGSGARMPMAMPQNAQRRDSHSINGTDVISPGAGRQPVHHMAPEQHPTWTQKPSPSLSNAQPVSPYGSIGSAAPHESTTQAPLPIPVETAVEMQQRLMREKMERARLAKQKEREREEQEEAERKERLRIKLEAMGLNEAKAKPKEQSPSRPVEKSPLKEKAVLAAAHSPPKPPVVTAEGEVAQYGMMKVHQPHPVKKPHQPELAAPKQSRGPETAPKTSSSSPVKRQAELQPTPAPSNAERSALPPTPLTQDSRDKKSPSDQSRVQPQLQQSQDVRSQNQGLKSTQPPPAAWSAAPLTSQASRPWASSSVWGPPATQDRPALGNGTFDSAYRGPTRTGPSPQLPQQLQTGQAPTLGLNPSLPSRAQSQAPSKQPFSAQTMPAQQLQAVAKPGPGPIAPPVNKGWGNYAAAIAHDDKAMVLKAKQDIQRMGGEAFRPEIHETYTDQQGNSQKKVHEKVGGQPTLVNGIKPDTAPTTCAKVKPKDDVSGQPGGTTAGEVATAPAARSSRFFPRTSDPVPLVSTVPSKLEFPTGPPPPETESHPAFASSSQRPVVRMPRPSPRVRLPPAAVENQPDTAVSMPSRARLGMGARPLALNPEWQARFNSLLDKPGAPASAAGPKSSSQARQGVLAIAASSKAPLEVRQNRGSATVSLPSAVVRRPFVDDKSSDITSRNSAEEILLEEREFGSLPVVKVPKVPHLAAGEPPAPFPTNRPNNRGGSNLSTTTKPPFHVIDFDRNSDTIDVIVRLMGMRGTVTKTMAKKRDNRKGPGHKGPKRNFTPNNGGTNPAQTQRSRKPSNYQGQGSTSNNAARPSGGNAWNNNRSGPAHTSTTWPRRQELAH